jgi:hypothetical protein
VSKFPNQRLGRIFNLGTDQTETTAEEHACSKHPWAKSSYNGCAHAPSAKVGTAANITKARTVVTLAERSEREVRWQNEKICGKRRESVER